MGQRRGRSRAGAGRAGGGVGRPPAEQGQMRAGSQHPRIRSQARGRRPTTEPPAPCGCFNCSREGTFPARSTPTCSVVWGLNKVFKTLLTTSHRDCRQARVSHRPVFSSSFIYGLRIRRTMTIGKRNPFPAPSRCLRPRRRLRLRDASNGDTSPPWSPRAVAAVLGRRRDVTRP